MQGEINMMNHYLEHPLTDVSNHVKTDIPVLVP